MSQENVWHALNVEEILKKLETSERGLTKTEAEKRLSEYGANELKKRKRISPLQIFLAQFKNIFVIMLSAAIIISVIIGWYEAKATEARLAIETFVDAIAIGMIV
ncbi:MAG TPA: cation-transporting P-type ATPase, partial [Candidatus Bathyarchaeia archaeon]